MTEPRFQAISVFHRQGCRVAHILDTAAGRDLYIHRSPDGKYLHWDRLDKPVEIEALRQVARKALAARRSQLRVRRVVVVEPVRPPRPCMKCDQEFTPKCPASKICPSCRSASARRPTALPRQGAIVTKVKPHCARTGEALELAGMVR